MPVNESERLVVDTLDEELFPGVKLRPTGPDFEQQAAQTVARRTLNDARTRSCRPSVGQFTRQPSSLVESELHDELYFGVDIGNLRTEIDDAICT